jgi:hypothetical protein
MSSSSSGSPYSSRSSCARSCSPPSSSTARRCRRHQRDRVGVRRRPLRTVSSSTPSRGGASESDRSRVRTPVSDVRRRHCWLGVGGTTPHPAPSRGRWPRPGSTPASERRTGRAPPGGMDERQVGDRLCNETLHDRQVGERHRASLCPITCGGEEALVNETISPCACFRGDLVPDSQKDGQGDGQIRVDLSESTP